jgi:hypothetical protein
VETIVVEIVEESVSVDVKLTVVVVKTVLVYKVAVGLRLYDWGGHGLKARFPRYYASVK